MNTLDAGQTSAPPPAAEPSSGSPVQLAMQGKSPEVVALATVDALLSQSPLTPEKQMAVALNAAVLALGRMPPTIWHARGKIINSALDDFRVRLQQFLPRAQAVQLPIHPKDRRPL